MSRHSREPNSSLILRNLTEGARSDDLRDLFGKFGSLKDVYIPLDYHTRRQRGFAYVQFEDPRDARDALEELDRTMYNGNELRIDHAKGDRKSPGEMRSKERGGRYGRDDRGRDDYHRRGRRHDDDDDDDHRRRDRSRSRNRRRRSRSGSRHNRRDRSDSRSRRTRYRSPESPKRRDRSDSRSRRRCDSPKSSVRRDRSNNDGSVSRNERSVSKRRSPSNKSISRSPVKMDSARWDDDNAKSDYSPQKGNSLARDSKSRSRSVSK